MNMVPEYFYMQHRNEAYLVCFYTKKILKFELNNDLKVWLHVWQITLSLTRTSNETYWGFIYSLMFVYSLYYAVGDPILISAYLFQFKVSYRWSTLLLFSIKQFPQFKDKIPEEHSDTPL